MSSPSSPTYPTFGGRSPYSSGSSASFPNEDSPGPDSAYEPVQNHDEPVVVASPSDYSYHLAIPGMAVYASQSDLHYPSDEHDAFSYPTSLMSAWNTDAKKRSLQHLYPQQQQPPSHSLPELDRSYKTLMAYNQQQAAQQSYQPQSSVSHHLPSTQSYYELDGGDSWQAYPSSLGQQHLGQQQQHLGQHYAGHGYAAVKQEEPAMSISSHQQQQQPRAVPQSMHAYQSSANMQAFYDEPHSQSYRSQHASHVTIPSSFEQQFVHLSDVSPVESSVSPVAGMQQPQPQYPSDMTVCDPHFVSGRRQREERYGTDRTSEPQGERDGDGEDDAEGEEDESDRGDEDVDMDGDDVAELEDDDEYVIRRGRRNSAPSEVGESRSLRLRSTPMRTAAARYNPYASESAPLRPRRASSMTAASSTSSTATLDDMYLPTLNGQPVTTRRRPRPATSLPIPVPVPNLTKKSRGRRVPTAPTPDSARLATVVRANADGQLQGGGRRGSTKGLRLYTCKVAGCGKCFARGEHLKRHVRSIHTHEKPHKCPYPGCGKDFSRHDNLGQHMRVHKDYVLPKGVSLNSFRA
uniref:C2H2-type domain-containing protein n=2 Tax=Schizophyllum commune (strain H4-8 / FGSC 9210) TaxID=578458 RepID=D8QKZ0_SCHCM